MADSVDSLVMLNGSRRYTVRLTNISDGTGESAVIKVDKSTLLNGQGVEPSKLMIKTLKWSIQGFTSVRLYWDHTTDDELAVLSGTGERSYDPPMIDPASAGQTGDILLTTAGNISGATYDIVIECVY